MESRFVLFVSGALAFMAMVLMLDRPGLMAQVGLGLATAAFLWGFVRKAEIDPRQILSAIVIATCGEVVLSMGWGLYTYKNATIPFYVFPGHGVFYALAVFTARQEKLQARGAAITQTVLFLGTIVAAGSALLLHDRWGALWWGVSCVLILRSENRLLLASCVVYTILLEWIGTAIGNWRWLPEVPFLSVHSANPPAGVSVLYILLDLMAAAACAKLWRNRERVEEAPAEKEAPYPVPTLAGPG